MVTGGEYGARGRRALGGQADCECRNRVRSTGRRYHTLEQPQSPQRKQTPGGRK